MIGPALKSAGHFIPTIGDWATLRKLVKKQSGMDFTNYPKNVYSVHILPENYRSQAVAKRLGFVVIDRRYLSHFPSEPHDIWALDKQEYLSKFS